MRDHIEISYQNLKKGLYENKLQNPSNIKTITINNIDSLGINDNFQITTLLTLCENCSKLNLSFCIKLSSNFDWDGENGIFSNTIKNSSENMRNRQLDVTVSQNISPKNSNQHRLNLACAFSFTLVFTWALLEHFGNPFTSYNKFNAIGIGLASMTAIFCFIAFLIVVKNTDENKAKLNNKAKIGALLNGFGLVIAGFGSFALIGSLAKSNNIKSIHNLPYLAGGLFVIATIFLAIGHLLNIGKSTKENEVQSDSADKQRYWGIDGVLFFMQTIGAFSLFNEGLQIAGLNHIDINTSGIKVMLIIGIIGAFGMIFKNIYNAKKDDVDYLPNIPTCSCLCN